MVYKDRAFLHFMSSDTENAEKDLNSAFNINQQDKGEFLRKVVDAKDEVIGHHEQALNAKDDLITHLENIINSLDESTQIKMLRKLGLLKKKPS